VSLVLSARLDERRLERTVKPALVRSKSQAVFLNERRCDSQGLRN
jgi:hypothetical protein